MKKCFALLCLLAMAPICTQASGNNGIYVDVGLGHGSAASYLPSDTVANIDVGYHWSWFGLQAGYVDFSKTSFPVGSMDGTPVGNGNFKGHGYSADMTGHWDIVSNWYLSARLGALFRQETWNIPFETTSHHIVQQHFRDSGTSLHAGLGAGYDFNDNFGIGLNYDWYIRSRGNGQTAKVPSLSAQFRF